MFSADFESQHGTTVRTARLDDAVGEIEKNVAPLMSLPTSASAQVGRGRVLVTGGSGFFGGLLKRRLLSEGFSVVSLDLEKDENRHPFLQSVQGDIRDPELVRHLFETDSFRAVYHAAAQLAHGMHMDNHLLWSSNVDGTRVVAEAASDAGVKPFVFLSSNCLWACDLGHPVNEESDVPARREPLTTHTTEP